MDKTKKKLIVSRYFPPHIGGTATVLYNLLKKEKPDTYCVLTGDTSGIDGLPTDKKVKLNCNYYRSDLPRFVLKIFGNNKITSLLRLLMLPMVVAKGLWVIKKEKCEQILGIFPFRSFFIASYLIHRFSGVPLYYYLQDIYGQVPARGFFPFLDRVIEKLFKENAFNAATRIMGITEPIRQYYKETMGINVEVLEIPIDLMTSSKNTDLKRKQKKQVVYTGTVSQYQADALKRISDIVNESNDLELQICTISPSKTLEQFNIGGDNVFIKHLGMLEARNMQQTADILFIPLTFNIEDDIIKTCYPSKTWEYFMAKKPVLVHGPLTSYYVRDMKERELTFVVDKPDKVALEKMIYHILSNNQTINWLKNSREELRAHRIDVVLEKYHRFLN